MARHLVFGLSLFAALSLTGCWRAIGNGKIVVASGIAHPISDIEDLHAKALAKFDSLEKEKALDPVAITARQNSSIQDIARLRAALTADLTPAVPVSTESGSTSTGGSSAPAIPPLPDADKSALASAQFSALAAAAGLASQLEDSPADLISGTRDIYETLIPARLRFKQDTLRASGYEFFHIPMTIAVHPGNRTRKKFMADIRFDYCGSFPIDPKSGKAIYPDASEVLPDYRRVASEWKKARVLDFVSNVAETERSRILDALQPLIENKSKLKNSLNAEKAKPAEWAEGIKRLVDDIHRLDSNFPDWSPTSGESAVDTAKRWCREHAVTIPNFTAPIPPPSGRRDREAVDIAIAQKRNGLLGELEILCAAGDKILADAAKATAKLEPGIAANDAQIGKLQSAKCALEAAQQSLSDEIERLNHLRYLLVNIVIPLGDDDESRSRQSSNYRSRYKSDPTPEPNSEAALNLGLMKESVKWAPVELNSTLNIFETKERQEDFIGGAPPAADATFLQKAFLNELSGSPQVLVEEDSTDQSKQYATLGESIQNQTPDVWAKEILLKWADASEASDLNLDHAAKVRSALDGIMAAYASTLRAAPTPTGQLPAMPECTIDREAWIRYYCALRDELADAFRDATRYIGLIDSLHRVDDDSVQVFTVSPLRQMDRRAETLARRVQREYAFQFMASGPLGQIGTAAGNLGADRLTRLEQDLATVTKEPVLTGYVEDPSSFGWRVYPTLALDEDGKSAERFMTPGPRDVMVVIAVRRRNWENIRDLIHGSVTLPELNSQFFYRANWIREGHRSFLLRRELPPENQVAKPPQYFNPYFGNAPSEFDELGTGYISLTLPPQVTRAPLDALIPAGATTAFKGDAALLEIVGTGFSSETKAIINNTEIAPQRPSPTRIFVPINPATFPEKSNTYSVRLSDGPGRETLLERTITVEGKAKAVPDKASVEFAAAPTIIQPRMSFALNYKGPKNVNTLPEDILVFVGGVKAEQLQVFDKKKGSFGFTVPVIPDMAQGLVSVTVQIDKESYNVGQPLYVNATPAPKKDGLTLSIPGQ